VSRGDQGRRDAKRALLSKLLEHVAGEIATMTRAHDDARQAATHEEAKPENDKDTRALEASYLAAGQAARVAELELAAKVLAGLELKDFGPETPIQAGAVVTVEDDDGARSTYFVAPHGGGVKLEAAGAGAAALGPIQVITPQSPLGQALLGRTQGDVVELRAKAGLREMTVADVW